MITGWDRREARYLVLAMVWLALTLGVRPLAIPDEGRYVSSAWEMVVSGNWLYPTLNGLPFFHKPPLYYWITGGSLAVFGTHEWASRLVSLFGAGVAAFTMYGFALRQDSRYVARLALLILITQPLFFGSAQFATLDMLVAGFISATTLLAAEAAINASTGKEHRGLLAAAYVCAALGVLSKGLIGAVLPGLAIAIWLLWTRRLALLGKLLWLPGLALFAVIALPWFLAMQSRFPGFMHYFFVYQQFQRFAQGGFNNPRPFWFYLPVLFVGMLPWSLLIPAALRPPPVAEGGIPAVRSLMWIAAAVTVGFFSIPASKTVGYVLPAVPPVAYLIADGLARKWGGPEEGLRRLRWLAAAGAMLCLTAVIAVRIADHHSNKALSRQIAAQRQSGEPIFFVKYQYFDVPFYLRLREPVQIVDDWDRHGGGDDWHTALVDAAKFAPDLARQLLTDRRQFTQALCSSATSWVIVKKGVEADFPFLDEASRFAGMPDKAVWKLSSRELAAKGYCGQTPSAGSSGTSARRPPPG